jgi:2-C-methyl-D-erythritol 4-phosphate cytidylyltransferase
MITDLDNQRFFAIVPAAGVGKRMQTEIPKQYLTLNGKTILEHTLGKLLSEEKLQRIVVPVSRTDSSWQMLSILKNEKISIVEGGKTRCQSVINGLRSLSNDCSDADWVLVHDVARPCIESVDVRLLMRELCNDSVGGILAVPASDTIKHVDKNLAINKTVDRSTLWHAQTPQMFRYKLLLDALTKATDRGLSVTDEASAIELSGYKPKVVEGNRANIKITRPEDLSLAEFYLQQRD